jgi:hypothetical protein
MHRVKALVAMVFVGGLFTMAALPAYAALKTETVADTTANLAGGQSIDATSAEASVPAARDMFTVTSAAERLVAVRSQQYKDRLAAYNASGARELGDDYPWAAMPTAGEGGGLSPLRYFYRECVDFVAWRLNRDAGSTSAPFKWDWSNLTPGGGSASSWPKQWAAHGWPTSNVPVAGAVAYTSYNHVAYVKEVIGDGNIVLEDYNWNDHAYDQRVVSASSVILFLYAPP